MDSTEQHGLNAPTRDELLQNLVHARRRDVAFIASVYALIATVSLYAASRGNASLQFSIPLCWLGITALIGAVAYTFNRPSSFGHLDRSLAGRMCRLFVLPHESVAHGVVLAQRTFTNEPSVQEIAPKLFLSRRPRANELPENLALVIDCTCEFSPSLPWTDARHKRLASLDGTAADLKSFREVVASISADQVTLVHCAAGHGRSATVVAACLIQRRLARSPAEAWEAIRKIRPGIRPSHSQRALLELWHHESQAAA